MLKTQQQQQQKQKNEIIFLNNTSERAPQKLKKLSQLGKNKIVSFHAQLTFNFVRGPISAPDPPGLDQGGSQAKQPPPPCLAQMGPMGP